VSFIQRELNRIEIALRQPQSRNHYAELYVAQQALAWALDPTGFAAPLTMITGTPAGSEDCPAELRPAPF
jgi:hypothetical protein